MAGSARGGIAGEFGDGDAMPPGPYHVGLTKVLKSGGVVSYEGIPWTVCCGDGRAIAGHVPSRAMAEAIVAALNQERRPHDEPE